MGDPGENFDGSRLVGIADTTAVENFDLRSVYGLQLEGSVPVQGPGGQPDMIAYSLEDYLH